MSKFKCLAPLAMVVTLMSSAPAFALSDWCLTPAFPTTCTTLAIPANSSGHFIFYRIGAWTNYRIQDIETTVFIRSGVTGGGTRQETVFGLVGWYELSVKGIGAFGYISNT